MKTHKTVGALFAVLFAVLEVSAAHGRPRPGSSFTPASETTPYSQRDPLYHRKTRNDLSSTVPAASSLRAKPRVDRQTQTVYSTLPDSVAAGGHYAPVVGPSAAGSYGPPAPVHHEYPEPIIEIIIKESNESLPAPPPPPPPPPRKKAREPVHVFYVKYKQNPSEYGKEGGVVFDEPIPALTPAPPPEEEEEDSPPETVTYAPAPRPTTTLRAIIHPDSEIAHGSEGRLRVTFGGPHDDEQPPSDTYGQGLKRADDKETQESVQSAPQPAIAFPGPAAITKRQQPGPAHPQQTAQHSVGQGRSHNPPPPPPPPPPVQPFNQYQRQYSTIPQEAYRGPFAPSTPVTSFRPNSQLQPLENPRYPNVGSFPSGPVGNQGGDRPIISDKPPPHQRQAPFPGSFPHNPNSFPQNNFFSNRPPFAQPQQFPAPTLQQQPARIPQHQLLRERHHQQVIQQQLLRQQQEQQQKLQQQQQAQQQFIDQQKQQQHAQQQFIDQQKQQQHAQQQFIDQQKQQQQAQQQFIDQQKQHQHVLDQQKQQQYALEQQKRQQLIEQQRQQYLQQQQQIHIQQSPQQNPFNIPTSTRFQPRPPISPISIPASAEIVKSIPHAELHKVEQVPQFQIQQNTAPFQPSQPINVETLPIKPETPEQTFQLLKQRQYQQQQEARLRQQQLIQQQQYQREQEQRIIQQQQEQQAYLRQRQEQERLEHQQRQQFLLHHNSGTPDEDIPPYRVRFSPTPQPQPSISIAPSTSTAATPSSTTESPTTEAPKTEEPKIDLSKKLAELPDEVPDDVRQHLLSSGILKDAQIQILDYDKIGDVPIEDLPPHALENFYGAGGGSAVSASETSSSITKPGSSKTNSRSDDQDSDNESEGSEIHERFAAPDAESSPSQVEMKVVRYDPTTAAGQSVAEKYVQKGATQVDPVVLNDNRYNRYLPLKVSGTQFPLPEEPLLRGRQVTSVVVLAPVDYDYLKPLPSDAEEKSSQTSDRTGRAVEAHGVRFLAGEALRNLVREPSADNFRAWLQRERATPLEHQSVILLVTNSDGMTEQKADRQIFMYDPVSEQVSRLSGELSSSFVEVAESNAKSEDLDTLAEQGGVEDSMNTAASEQVEVRLKPERRTKLVSDMDPSESQWTPIVGYSRRS